MSAKARYIQIVADAAIPVLGLLLWNWGLYFILLFYFIDLSADLVITFLKSKKIKEERGEKAGLLPIWTTILFFLSIAVIHLSVWFIYSEINFIAEVKAFWTYKELGVEQGYVLVPLVWLITYQQYKMEFIRMKQYTMISAETLWRNKFIAYLIIGIAAGLCIALSMVITFEDWVYVSGIVVLSSVYQLIKN